MPTLQPEDSRRVIRSVGSMYAPAWYVTLAAALGLAPLASCVSPAQRADLIAQESGFHKEIVTGILFRHVLYRSSARALDGPRSARAAGQTSELPTGAARRAAGSLHVYIEGDGSPFFPTRDLIAADPTPREPLMLRLMTLDPSPSVYLGRPCYFGLAADPGCGPLLWTFRRFAPEVLDSMERVLRAQSARSGASEIMLFGHSGGGTLAVLLAQRVESVTRVVTIGATLDTAAWCELHGYSPLIGSANPIDEPHDRAGLESLHLVGEHDTNTPPALIRAAARARGGEAVEVISAFDHNCCWERVWPDILRKISPRTDAIPP
ncbi:MAG TPA: hypothetical protein VK437_10030 [Steroidobacteraceae bacterium]|nr:hypothetical protein [Steroidobacteraceae bacterium]